MREAVGSQRGKRGVINARRKAMAYPGTRKLPCPGITRREASLRGDTSLLATRAIYGLGDEADPPDHPLPALDGGSTSRRFVHRARQRLSKLFIANITFYSRRTAAARRPDGTSAVSRDGGCGEEKKRKKKMNGRDTSCCMIVRCVSARPDVRTSKCKRACAERVERKTRKRRG